ncbi:hypothetical protein U9M48_037005 [Paspalum notatum var. saurae]|uniref:Uncharacterized protein n=1 Tax=Paspalum notatum var. saurae TaxID=547442 RepID=A0AAQ3XAM3_PASNO
MLLLRILHHKLGSGRSLSTPPMILAPKNDPFSFLAIPMAAEIRLGLPSVSVPANACALKKNQYSAQRNTLSMIGSTVPMFATRRLLVVMITLLSSLQHRLRICRRSSNT